MRQCIKAAAHLYANLQVFSHLTNSQLPAATSVIAHRRLDVTATYKEQDIHLLKHTNFKEGHMTTCMTNLLERAPKAHAHKQPCKAGPKMRTRVMRYAPPWAQSSCWMYSTAAPLYVQADQLLCWHARRAAAPPASPQRLHTGCHIDHEAAVTAVPHLVRTGMHRIK
jgi:hypothetical protein